MRALLIILLTLITTLVEAQDAINDPYTQVQGYLVDSGYTYTRRWIGRTLNDSTSRYKSFLDAKATKYFNDGVCYRAQVDFLNDDTKWTEQSVQFKHSYQSLSYSIVGSRATRFGLLAHQLNVDAYYVFNKHFYANVDVATGQSQLYPQYRTSLKLYYTGLRKLELATGYSYVSFKNNPVSMYRLSAGVYFSNFYLYAEYLHINTPKQKNYAIVMWLRNYFPNAKGYFFLNGSAGLQSDRLNLYGDFMNSRRLSGGVSYRPLPRFSFELAVSTEKQILSEAISRQLLSVNTALFYHFQFDKRK